MDDHIRALLVGFSFGAIVGMPTGMLIERLSPPAPAATSEFEFDGSYPVGGVANDFTILHAEMTKQPMRFDRDLCGYPTDQGCKK